MLTLHRYIFALVLWLALLFNIERLDIGLGTPNLLNIPPAVYVAVLIVTCGALWVGQAQRLGLRVVQVVSVALCVVALLLDRRPDWGGGYTYLSLVSLMEVLVSATLAFQVGRFSADFVQTVQAMVLTNLDSRIYTDEESGPPLKRELQQARRTGRPLSVVVIEPEESQTPQLRSATAREIERLLTKRYQLVALARLVARSLRRTDLLLYQSDQERLVLVAPETPREPTMRLVERVRHRVQQRLGVAVRCRVATFPQQGLTFEELLAQAEQSDGATPSAGAPHGEGERAMPERLHAAVAPAHGVVTGSQSNGHP